tara:strand:- start:449 stop:661 length:213 start_codon:yes stop_codon:yes gene_type:complete
MTTNNPDKVFNHIKALYLKKKELDTRIEVCYAERVNDEIINSMKQSKVKLNDEIVKYKRMYTELTGENYG